MKFPWLPRDWDRNRDWERQASGVLFSRLKKERWGTKTEEEAAAAIATQGDGEFFNDVTFRRALKSFEYKLFAVSSMSLRPRRPLYMYRISRDVFMNSLSPSCLLCQLASCESEMRDMFPENPWGCGLCRGGHCQWTQKLSQLCKIYAKLQEPWTLEKKICICIYSIYRKLIWPS